MEIDKLKEIAQKVETSRSQIQNEQATKTAFIMPFLQAWGYDVFNPMEVHPEYSADLTGLKGEKVDYAICLDNQPIILMECKSCHQNLEHPKHSSQLHRYFNATGANFGVLTNGIKSTCPECGSSKVHKQKTRVLASGNKRDEYKCQECGRYHSKYVK